MNWKWLFVTTMICFALEFDSHVLAEGNCWVVAIAMNQDKAATEDWNQYGEETALVFERQAKELFKTVRAKTVLGRNATLPAIAEAIRWAFTSAKSGDLVVVHIACHGGTQKRDGWSVDTMDGQLMYGRDLKLAAAKLKCPVFFLIDTCESGGFSRAHVRDIELPRNCVAFCSSRSRQSTTNVLNIAISEGLWGASDQDQNGCIELGELIEYVRLRAPKISPKGESLKDSEIPVIVKGESISDDLPLTKCADDLVAVVHDRTWHLARLVSEDGNIARVHVMGYQDDPSKGYFYFNEVPVKRVFKTSPDAVPVIVTVDGKVRPALATQWNGPKVTVRYVLAGKKSEEEVERTAVRLAFSRFRGLGE